MRSQKLFYLPFVGLMHQYLFFISGSPFFSCKAPAAPTSQFFFSSSSSWSSYSQLAWLRQKLPLLNFPPLNFFPFLLPPCSAAANIPEIIFLLLVRPLSLPLSTFAQSSLGPCGGLARLQFFAEKMHFSFRTPLFSALL